MDINFEISKELYSVIEKNYKNENYSGAILDAMHLLTETIRDKTGLEGDGSALIGNAFGGNNPKIQINKLQTDSEKSIQKGIQEIMRGFYSAIRNPRSHDKLKDTKKETDVIILFIDYLLETIDKSKLSFEESTFLKRIFDKHFVKSKEYSDLLVAEIPKRQRADIGITVLLDRNKGNLESLSYFIASLFDKLESNEIDRIYKVISKELMHASSFHDIQPFLYLCPGKFWNKVNKAVKIRIENILLEDLKTANYDKDNDMCEISGSLGTWVTKEHLVNFEDPSDWTYNSVLKLQNDKFGERIYIEEYYWRNICSINYASIHWSLKLYISRGLKNKDEYIVNKLKYQIINNENHPWWEIFKEELKDFPEIKYDEDEFPF
ncbi:TIGR02391 family protein [Fusobacteria bacterium ZRK30]|nr:TIGR02391 family protein [Fusobacteria bacterium ZRK30]